ncbi:Threonine/homoserine efflux transporter RhtA [Pseudonocardia thermophila]|uniref:Threonine/homoserine efflux transporter RhtA n=1 Tax=Pseudonocardia thermophila TaxID=1848 RepID=A0A1M7BG84_PSETH|nr:DMT family transporter [Pseudonocardia thermophila]SHL53619.1 Threonine/homoserine efflux transporter RhtA [Pseudonocardia thermophila]
MPLLTHDNAARSLSGLGFAAISAVSFALSGPIAGGLLDAGWSPAAAVAVRVLIGGSVLVPPAVVALRGRWAQLRRQLPVLLLYGLGPVAGTQFAYFAALRHLPVAVALLIEYTSPIAVVAWLWLRHAQRPAALTVGGALLGMTGLVLVLDPGGGAFSWIGVGWALLAMLGAALYFLLSARTGDALPGVVLAAGALLTGGVVLLLAGLVGVLPFTVTAATVALGGAVLPWWVPVLALGVVTAALSYATGIEAARRLGARLASFCGLAEVVAAVVLAWLLLGQVPRPVQLVGAALVLAGVALVKLGEPEPAAAPAEIAEITARER